MSGYSRKYCCRRMADAAEGWLDRCTSHEYARQCPDALVSVHGSGEHGIIVHDGGGSHVAIDYCPWCRADLRVAGAGVAR